MRPPVPVVLTILCIAVAGCITELPGSPSGPDLSGALPLPNFLPPVAVSHTAPGAEPVVAVASDGTLFVEGVGTTLLPGTNVRTNVNKVWRSTDRGGTWTDVTPPGPGQERSNDGFVAVGNGDTVYAANVFSLTLQVYRSTDKGNTWTLLNVPRIPLLMHRHWIVPEGDSTVHLAIEAFPPEYGTYLAGQRPVTDPLGTPNQGMWYTRSTDRGSTWTSPVLIDPNVNFAGQGNLVLDAPRRALYVVRYEEPGRSAFAQTYESGTWYLVASHDGGNTWRRTPMFDLTSELAAALPSTAVDATGKLYVAWSQEAAGASRLHYAYSKDQGATWSPPQRIPVGDGAHAMPWIVARGSGEVGLMWYHADAEGRASKIDVPWYVEYALVTEADTPALTVSRARVTPEAVHVGNICAKGPACGPGEDRRLLDYPWIAWDAGGAAQLVFASTQWDRPSAFAVFAREAGQASAD